MTPGAVRRIIPTETLGIEEPPLTAPVVAHAAPVIASTIPDGSLSTAPRQAFHGSGAVSFSTKGEYGVRLMVQLGRHFGQGPASLAEIAMAEDLPRAYLEQLVMSLRDAGLVISTRGARGGYELARAPIDTRMSDILRALEGPIAPMFCATEDAEHATVCGRTSTCTVNLLWVRVRDAIAGALDTMTLADLVPLRTAPLPVSVSVPAAVAAPTSPDHTGA